MFGVWLKEYGTDLVCQNRGVDVLSDEERQITIKRRPQSFIDIQLTCCRKTALACHAWAHSDIFVVGCERRPRRNHTAFRAEELSVQVPLDELGSRQSSLESMLRDREKERAACGGGKAKKCLNSIPGDAEVAALPSRVARAAATLRRHRKKNV